MNNPTCPKCRHADHDGYPCLNMASDNDCPCTSPSGMYPALSSPPTDDVRAWRPEDGDTRCQSCGRPNPIWWADNADWNRLMPNDGVLCPTCYHALWMGGQIVAPHLPPPAEDVREAAQTFAEHVGWNWDALNPMWQEAFTQAAQKVLARPRGPVTAAEVDAAVRAYWAHYDPAEERISGMVRGRIRAALEADRNARFESAENTQPTNHLNGDRDA